MNGTSLIVEPDILSAMSTIESRYGIYKTRLYLSKNKEFDEIDDVTSDQVTSVPSKKPHFVLILKNHWQFNAINFSCNQC